jgi:hypothetical protein
MPNENRYDLQLQSLLDECDRSLIQCSDAEVLEEARVAGVDPVENAKALRERFLGTARRYQKRKFEAAKQAYNAETEAFSTRSYRLPTTAAEQRVLLQLVIAQQVQVGSGLTAKFRDFESLPDSDLPGLLDELNALGLLPKLEDQE